MRKVKRDGSEEVVLGVENEVDYENDSSVVKGVNHEFGVVFGDSVGMIKRYWWWSWKW